MDAFGQKDNYDMKYQRKPVVDYLSWQVFLHEGKESFYDKG